MTVLPTTRPRQSVGYTLIRVAGSNDFCLSHPTQTSVLRTNAIAAVIWSLCNGQRTVNDIVTLLSQAYPDAHVINSDVQQTLTTLTQYGAIEWLAATGYDIPILLYHKVAPEPPPGNTVWISTRLFAEQMATLSAHGYVTVSFQDYLAYRSGAATPPPRPVILTFDDGYENFYTIARPILNRYGFKATVFLVTSQIGAKRHKDNRWDAPEAQHHVRMMIWPEVTILAEEGHSFGSHTRHHISLAAIREEQVRREIKESFTDLRAHLSAAPLVFSYPFGDGAGMTHIQTLVREAGYSAAVSTIAGIANTLTSNIWALPRLKITEADSITLDARRLGDSFLHKIAPQRPMMEPAARSLCKEK